MSGQWLVGGKHMVCVCMWTVSGLWRRVEVFLAARQLLYCAYSQHTMRDWCKSVISKSFFFFWSTPRSPVVWCQVYSLLLVYKVNISHQNRKGFVLWGAWMCSESVFLLSFVTHLYLPLHQNVGTSLYPADSGAELYIVVWELVRIISIESILPFSTANPGMGCNDSRPNNVAQMFPCQPHPPVLSGRVESLPSWRGKTWCSFL